MVIGLIWEGSPGCWYRAIYPLRLLERRGHEVVWPAEEGSQTVATMSRCDVVFVYRRIDDATLEVLQRLKERNIPIVWDNDDDLSKLPEEYLRRYRGLTPMETRGLNRQTSKAVRLADRIITTTDVLADKFQRMGVDQVDVIANYAPGKPRRGRRGHDGVVVGWIAGREHMVDAKELKLARTLGALVDAHPDVHVECVGTDLNLPERYRFDDTLPFERLPDRMAAFDIGIAPLTDRPFNLARSNIKVKEYAASGVPWLASPTGPYVGLGAEQGGRLVDDGEWLNALDDLVTDRRERKRLGKRGKAWAKRERLETEVWRWETIFKECVSSNGR